VLKIETRIENTQLNPNPTQSNILLNVNWFLGLHILILVSWFMQPLF